MAFKAAQVAVAGTAVPLWQEPGGTAVGNEPVLTNSGRLDDPVPYLVTFSAAVYLGPTGVTSSTGALYPANTPLALRFFGSNEQLFAVDAGTSVTAYVLVGRQ